MAALAAVGLGVTAPDQRLVRERPHLRRTGAICADGNPPGPAVAEGWDDWGPFYTPMYTSSSA